MTNLKPCPFCGSKDLRAVKFTNNHASVVCDKCFTYGPESKNEAAAIKTWNRRRTMTNREWLNTLTDEELAKHIECIRRVDPSIQKCPYGKFCPECKTTWLKEEHKEENND
ncbi:MAG: Lar family restriction alleviation protein [Synergistaceae bacterium]|nr:Lar family restriction alleviation protein [Synergistaceae bacterium]